MKLGELILNTTNYEDKDDLIYMIFVQNSDKDYDINSPAVMLLLTDEEACMDLAKISKLKCPNYSYFLENFIVKDIVTGLKNNPQFKNDEDLINRVIYYAKYDA